MDAIGIRLRESPRIEIVGRARLQLGSAAGSIDAALLDLSATGMGLATSAAAPKPLAGEECAFDLAFDGVRVEGRGVVVWSRRARPDRGDAANVGVYFHRLEGAGKSELAAILEQGLTAGRRPSIAARAIFAPVVERAGEGAAVPVAVLTEVSPPASLTEAAPPVSIPTISDVATPRSDPAPDPEPNGIPDPVPPAASAALSAALPEPEAEAAVPEPEPEIAVRVSPRAPELERREGLASAAGARVAAGAPSPARRRWIGLAAAVVGVVALLMLWSLLDREREPAPAGASPSLITAASDRPAAAPVEAVVEEPAPAQSAAAPPASGGPRTSTQAESSSGAVETLPDTLAAPDRSAPAPDAAPESAVRAAAPDAGPAASITRARRLLAIEPGADDGAEVLVLRADAPFRRQDVFAALIGLDPPRYLLRLSGIEHRWSPADLEVGSPLVQRVRTGLHATARGPELHIVLDLSTRAVDHSFAVEGDVLRVRLRPREP